MKNNHFILAILAAAGVAFTAASANAQFTTGDLLMGFRDTSTTQDYVIDLGPATNFDGQSSGFSETLSLGNVDADLVTLFGSNWATNPDVFWGVAAATSAPSYTLWAGEEEAAPTEVGSGYTEASSSAQNGAGSLINNVGDNLSSLEQSTNADNAYIQSSSAGTSWANYMPHGSYVSAFNYFSGPFEGNSSSGITSTSLDLFEMSHYNSGGTAPKGAYEGTFNISSNGAVQFAVVPEPSTYVSLALGAAALVVVSSRRRRVAQA